MYDEISISLNDIKINPAALIAASKFAERYSSVLNGFYFSLDAADILGWQSANPMELAQQLLVDEDTRERDARAEFLKLTDSHACHTNWNVITSSNDSLRRLICCDILFTNQPEQSDGGNLGSVSYINRLIAESHRPVMMIPKGWSAASIGSRVLVGWNSSPVAMRAITDAMPLLQSADKVMVVDIVKDHLVSTPDDLSPAIERYLDSKNVAHQLSVIHANKGRDGELTALTEFAEHNSADLIVVGGFGHSRIKEYVLGGMTRHLVENATIPVLFAH